MNGKFCIVHNSKNKIIINRDVIDGYLSEALPIVWNMDGKYYIIPQAVVQNAIDNVAIWEKFYSDKATRPNVVILWNQGIPISNQAGRALIGNSE